LIRRTLQERLENQRNRSYLLRWMPVDGGSV
jgi:hypothetical protein